MTRILCIRHAQSVWNAEGRWQGQADPPLSAHGREEARAVAAALDGLVEHVVSSDLLRALETAEIVAGELGLGEVAIEPDLREIGIGEWSGLTRDEIEERWPGGISGWRSGDFSPPGAEDREAFVARVLRGLEAVARNDRRPALVVTHGGAIGRLEQHLGVNPGVPMPRLSGRWFDVGSQFSTIGDRIDLLA